MLKKALAIGLASAALIGQAGRASAQVPAPAKPDAPARPDPAVTLALQLKDKAVEVRRAAAFSLKYLPQSEAVVGNLVDAFKDPDEVVRDNAVDAVVLMTPGSSVPALSAALRDRDPLLKRHAAQALGRIKRYTEEAVPELVALLKDANPNVRQAAAHALKAINGSTREY